MASEPTLVNNKGFNVAIGRSFIITEDLLKYVDDVSGPEDVTYTVNTPPSRGRIAIDGVEQNPIGDYPLTFTQADIAAGSVGFTTTGAASAATTAINFNSIKDAANNSLTGQSFTIKIFKAVGRRSWGRFTRF